MKIELISDDVRLNGIHEIIYEISINDSKYIYIRKSVFEKLNKGDYMLQMNGFSVVIKDRKTNEEVKKLTNTIY